MKEKKEIILDENFDPSSIKEMSNEELKDLSSKVRKKIIEACSRNGGHLSSNLGVVELTIALFKYYDFPKDKLIFDVGHQCYTQKILSGRSLDSLRKENGVDGFQKRNESIYDPYEAGHSSTSISAAMGFALSRDINKEDYKVIAVIGDASIANGLALEAINNLDSFHHKMLIILNDNEMSITEPVGSFNRTLQKIRTSNKYITSKNKYKKFMTKNNFLKKIYSSTAKIKGKVARHLLSTNVFEDFGLYYYGIVDGHDINAIYKAIKKIDKIDEPVLLHVSTKKGFGYQYSETDDKGTWHGVGPFNIETGESICKCDESKISFAKAYADELLSLMDEDNKVITITPATGLGSNLLSIKEKYPTRYFDVGIAEEHAVTFASGLATSNTKPYVIAYSTFLQRSYDEIHHDVARMDVGVRLIFDHAGLVGDDGETHQGIYDVSFLNSMPNMTIVMGKDYEEVKRIMRFSLSFNHPLAIRFPKGSCLKEDIKETKELVFGEWDYLKTTKKKNIALISYGPHIKELEEKLDDVTLINAIFIRPINEKVLKEILNYKNIIIYDPYSIKNGFVDVVKLRLLELGYEGNIVTIGLDNVFIKKGTVLEQERRYNVDVNSVINKVKELTNGSN